MRLRRQAPAFLIGAVIVVVATVALASNFLFAGMTRSVESKQFDMMQAIIQSNLESAEERALARAEMLAGLPSLQRMFAARDRPGLLAEYGRMFKEQQDKYGVDQLQFHTPPATSFLRLQAPETYGDDLSTFRPLVVAVNKDQKMRKGLSIARTGPAIFGVVPVHDAGGTHIGSLEVGLDFGAILDNLKAAYSFELAVFIEEEPLRQVATGVSGAVLDEDNRVGKYLKYHATHWDLLRSLVTGPDVSGLTAVKRYTRTALGVPYGVLLVPLTNASGKPIGVIAVAKDFHDTRAAAGRSVVWQVLLGIIAIALLAGTILMVVRGYLLRPLEAIALRFGDLAGGAHDRALDDADVACQELAEQATHHETLRSAAAAAAQPESPTDQPLGS